MQTPMPRDILFGERPLHAVVDCASDPDLYAQILTSGMEFQSLYEGAEGRELAPYGPLLVGLVREHSLTDALLKGWGKSWAIYVSGNLSLRELRDHFRHFLLVQVEGGGRRMYFRFYDPRVLRQFLPSCTPEQAGRFFGAIDAYWAEGRHPGSALRFTCGAAGLRRDEVAVSIL